MLTHNRLSALLDELRKLAEEAKQRGDQQVNVPGIKPDYWYGVQYRFSGLTPKTHY